MTEEKKQMLALVSKIADLEKEKIELEQRVHQLMDDYNNVVRQLNGQEERKDEYQPKQTLGEMLQMSNFFYRPESDNEQQQRFIEAIDSFIKQKNLYIPEGSSCPHAQDQPEVASQACLECGSCLRYLYGFGVVCRKTLEGLGIVRVKPLQGITELLEQ